MANRVRFLSLTLAGFGRYERPTRFDLGGRSCSFTSPNELGKSTFQAGLMAVLFGPPANRAKALAFQARYRNWTGGQPFWGELDFSVNGETWRVHQDFDSLTVKVWRVPAHGTLELRYESKPKSLRTATEPDPYIRLLEDWIGFDDRQLYEAMFTVSQESTLAASWQIDAHVAAQIYGPAVQRIERALHDLLDRFRQITRHTREYQLSVGSQGERNGRSDGRLDQVVARAAEVESSLESARGVAAELVQKRQRLGELDAQCEQTRAALEAAAVSLSSWRAWIDMESRLQPAVDSYERLKQLHERCQQVARPMAELRARLAGDWAVFNSAPDDLIERLEYLPLLAQAADDARRQRIESAARTDQLEAELADLENQFVTEFSLHLGRPQLPDQVEELQLVESEIASIQAQIAAWSQSEASNDDHRVVIEQIGRLAGWRRWSTDPEAQFQPVRLWIEQFAAEHAEFLATAEAIRSEREWLTEQDRRVERMEADQRAQLLSRERIRTEMSGSAAAAERHAVEARERTAAAEQARGEMERRYVDFRGAPDRLLELWDEWHSLEFEESAARHGVAAIQDELQQVETRTLWRRALTGFGVVVVVVCALLSPTWSGLWIAAAAAGLCVSLRWVYPIGREAPSEIHQRAEQAAFAIARIGRAKDELVRQIGAAFIVPAEREAEWRRLWPTYQREKARIDAELCALPDAETRHRLERESKQARENLDRFDAETAELLEDGRRAIANAEAERERRRQALARLEDAASTHIDRYFGGAANWADEPLERLNDAWLPAADIAGAELGMLQSVQQLVDWCCSLGEQSWSDFAERCRELRRLEQQIAPDADARAARAAELAQARDLLDSLESQRAALAAAIEPFSAATGVEWLRSQRAACHALESRIAEGRRMQSQPAELDAVVRRTEVEYAAAAETLGPYLARFGGNVEQVIAAWHERSDGLRHLVELESQAAELLAESGYASLEELAHEAGKAEGLVGTIRGESQELLAQAVELWSAVDAPPGLARDRAAELQTRCGELQASLEALERERAELVAAIRHADSDPRNDVAAHERELQSLHAERSELERRRDELAAEFQESNRLMQELKRVERTALEGRITAFFADFSRTTGRRVVLDEQLHMTIEHSDGTRYSPDQLSHGARDQLYLAVYLATTAGFDLPFVLDDPFVNCDDERLGAIRMCWDRLAPDRQLILLSHDAQMAAWSPPLEIRDAA